MIFGLWLFWPAMGFGAVALVSSAVGLGRGLNSAARDEARSAGGVAIAIAVAATFLCVFSMALGAAAYLYFLGVDLAVPND